jgi:tripartite-type tricarboxylate transporter receptor subunit TctC
MTKQWLSVLTASIALVAVIPASAQQAADYPSRPIKIVVPYPPGGTTDIITRLIAKGMTETWKQPVLVENRGGASGMIGTEVVAKAPSDGYTLLSTGSGPHVVNVSLFPKINYDPVKDFEPVSMVITIPLLMVAPAGAPYSDVAGFVDWAKKNKDKANYCSIGPGSPSHLAAELFKSMTKIELTHVPYKGSGPAIVDTIGGVCPVLFDSAVSSGPQVRSGKLKALAIGTAERVPSWSNVPTVAESGVPGFNAYTWGAMLAPAGTPKAIVDKLNVEIVRILATPEVRDVLAAQGATGGTGTPADLAAFTAVEIAKWAKVIKDGNIKAE